MSASQKIIPARFVRRIARAALLDPEIYEEVEADRGALVQAGTVVLLASLGIGIGSFENGGWTGLFWTTGVMLVSWVLWAPFNDAEIRYVMKSAMALRQDLVDRREIRVPVDLVANIWSGSRREVAVVSSLSPRGAFIELSMPLHKGSSMRIEMELPGDRFRGFARVVYENPDDPDRPDNPSGVGVTFYGSDRDSERILRKAISELEARYLP